MSDKDVSQEDPMVIAKRAERDLATNEAKTGSAGSDSLLESGVDESVETKFEGASVQFGSSASGAGDNREIPDEEGGELNRYTGRQTKAGDFEGPGGPDDQAEVAAVGRPGDDDIRSNIRE